MFKKISSRKTVVVVASLIILIASIVVTVVIVSNANKNSSSQTAELVTPTFNTLIPQDTSIEELGGWQKVSPDGNDPVYAYTDAIEGKAISVSQQALPESFKGDVNGQVKEMAKKFNATRNIDTSDTEVFIGTSSKGPQYVIFTKEGLLILMRSQENISDDAWKDYISSLNTFATTKF